tara:strand:+ start:119 stop:664 length:546 start_codon:yes stop_codon:yes gene_type:complete
VSKFLRLLVFIFGSTGLAAGVGCIEEEPWDPNQYRAKPKAKKKTQEAEEVKNDDLIVRQFSYNPVGKRDPFRSYLSVVEEEGNQKSERLLEKTEAFELDQYKLVALISGTSQPRAMVEDPKNEGHIVRIGSRLGKNGGRITRISNNSIVVVEEFRAPTGERIRVPITVKLPKEAELEIESH